VLDPRHFPEGISMVSKCANPACDKQLHYLRDGRVYVFETLTTSATDLKSAESHNEHFWLCGDCARDNFLEHSGGRVHVVHKPVRARQVMRHRTDRAMAS
jgi:hypothetical protein